MAGKEKLSARAVAAAKPGRYCDGRGLWLVVSKSGARKWIFRFTFGGRVTEMGLGNAAVSLAAARDKADEARKLVASGINPIEARRETKRLSAGKPTFGQCADALIETKSSEWRNEKHRAQWRMTLVKYAKPLRDVPVDQVDTEAVLGVLQAIWQGKPETASRLRGRIEVVLDAARAKGHIARNEANPARWRGHLDKLLPKRQKLSRGHHAAMAFNDVPEFIGRLRDREAIAALALEFAILTAARSGEILGARWTEIDLDTKVWTVPAGRMKAAREHRVPLSVRAMAILEKLAEGRAGEFVFPSQRAGKMLSGMALEMVLRRMKAEGVTVHGFRSAFRDWCGESTSFPREIAEAALAHVAGDATERAYRRGDALEKRRKLMEAWAGFCEAREFKQPVESPVSARKHERNRDRPVKLSALGFHEFLRRRRCVGMVDDDDVDAPEWDELTPLAKLLRDQNPKPERYRGKKGVALRELDELEEFIQRRDATPVERVRVGVRLWELNKTTLGVGPFCWRDRRRPRGAKNKVTDTEIDGQILMRAIDSKPLKGSLGATLRSLVEEFMANRRLPQLSVESHIKRLHKLAKRSGLA